MSSLYSSKTLSKTDVLYLNISNVKFSNKNIKIMVFQEPKYITFSYSVMILLEQGLQMRELQQQLVKCVEESPYYH